MHLSNDVSRLVPWGLLLTALVGYRVLDRKPAMIIGFLLSVFLLYLGVSLLSLRLFRVLRK
jgi:hypothetical protein